MHKSSAVFPSMSALANVIGRALRETGQAIDRVGLRAIN